MNVVYHLKSSDRLKQEIKYDRIIGFIRILYTVRIRSHFRYAYQRRLMKDMTNALKEIYDESSFKPIDWTNIWNEEDYSWEVI